MCVYILFFRKKKLTRMPKEMSPSLKQRIHNKNQKNNSSNNKRNQVHQQRKRDLYLEKLLCKRKDWQPKSKKRVYHDLLVDLVLHHFMSRKNISNNTINHFLHHLDKHHLVNRLCILLQEKQVQSI